MKNQSLIIDLDSTFVKVEALEELAKIVLDGNPHKGIVIEKIRRITDAGMEGKIPFKKSLSSRIQLLRINKRHIAAWRNKILSSVSESIKRNKEFFREHREKIFVISGAFKECIMSLIKEYQLDEQQVFANTFVFNTGGEVVGVESSSPLSGNDGKVQVVKALRLKGKVFVIGDGMSDYKIRKSGLAHSFIAYCENVRRESVISKADHVVSNFEEVLNILEMPTNLRG